MSEELYSVDKKVEEWVTKLFHSTEDGILLDDGKSRDVVSVMKQIDPLIPTECKSQWFIYVKHIACKCNYLAPEIRITGQQPLWTLLVDWLTDLVPSSHPNHQNIKKIIENK
jgi:hypothetical protein